jgi:hypothetical protein
MALDMEQVEQFLTRIERRLAKVEAMLVPREAGKKSMDLKYIENLFMILCSAILVQPDITKVKKLGFEELPVYLGQAQANPEYLAGALQVLAGYAQLFTAMQITLPTDLDGMKELAAFINSAGVYHGGTRWWDSCMWNKLS